MKRLRIIFIISVVVIISCIIMLHLQLIDSDDLIRGAGLGALISLVISFVLEYINYREESKDNVKDFIWKGVVPYNESLSEVFKHARDFYIYEKLFFEQYQIPREEGSWQAYEELYLAKKDFLEPRINWFVNEILSASRDHPNIVAKLSVLLTRIGNKTLLGFKNKDFAVCYKAYHTIENIDWTLRDAKKLIDQISYFTTDPVEKNCSLLIVLRWIGYTYVEDYDVGITPVDESEDSENSSATDEDDIIEIKAEKDLSAATKEIIEILN